MQSSSVEWWPRALRRNSPSTFYRGSGRIDRFRGSFGAGDDRPEDWVASTVTRSGEMTSGLTVLDTGGFLRDEVRADPASWLGFAGGSTPELEVPLVKLLDVGQRLAVHAHPSDADARALGVWPQGKAEGWFVLEAPPTGVVHVGWVRDVPLAELAGWVDSQDVASMLGAMHAVSVAAGDTVYIPPGTAHAIGSGIFLVEVQQAADLSILLEWRDFLDDSSGAFLGVHRSAALNCVDRRALPAATLDDLVERAALDRPVGTRLLPAWSAPYFSATLLGVGSALPSEYRTLVVIAGDGRLRAVAPAQTRVCEIPNGSTSAVPAAAGPLLVEGSNDLRVLAFGPGRRSDPG